MKEFNLDLQLHGVYAGGVSKNMLVPIIAEQAKLKGIDAVSSADILHKKWFEHVKQGIVEESNGVFSDKNSKCFFVVGTEVESKDRAHHLIYLPDFSAAEQLREKLIGFGNLDCAMCGRPVLRLNAEQIAENVEEAKGIIGPAHSFTPYTGIYAHHDSVRKAYGGMAESISFIELGLSADSALADLIEENHSYSFLTSSDAHCVHPDSFVTLIDGRLARISELWHKNETVLSFDFRKDTPAGAVPKIMKTKAPKFLLEIEANTKKLKATPEHRFFVLSEGNTITEKHASELSENEWIAINNNAEFCEKDIPADKPQITYYYRLSNTALQLLKGKRNRMKITQKDMEHKLKLKRDYYWRIESGQHKINENLLKSIFQLLEINPKNIEKTKYPAISFPKKLNNEKLCELIGYIVGDGCHEKGKKGDQLSLTDKEKSLLEYYAKSILTLFNENRKVGPKGRNKNTYRLRLSQKILEFFENVDRNILRTSNKRIVSEKIFFLGRSDTAAFLRGYFDAEGSIGHHHVDACSSNEMLLTQIHSLLLKFRINSSIYKNFEKTKKKYRYRLHIFGQENLLKFQKEINFNHQKKAIKLKKILGKFVQKPKQSFVKTYRNILWAKVQKINKVKADCKWVYDLSIDGYENYVVGGFITHNSPWPHRIGREFTRMKLKEPSFKEIRKAFERKQEKLITLNVGLNPKEGKYHLSACNACFTKYSAEQANQLNWKCMKCRGAIKKGVRDRIEELADFKEETHPDFRPPYMHSLPLAEIIQAAFGVNNINSQKVQSTWMDFVERFGNEINVLVDAEEEELNEVNQEVAKKVKAFREGLVLYIPGGGGNYGKPIICDSKEEFDSRKEILEKDINASQVSGQKTLGEF